MVCALVPVHELFITRLELSTGNSRKLETQSHDSAIAVTSTLRMGGILNSTETRVSVALKGGGTCGFRCTLAMHSGSVTKLQWPENLKLN